MKGFVSTREVANKEELGKLLEKLKKLAGKSSCYFWRSPHETSGFVSELSKDFNFASTIEGQMFNADFELRWKRRGEKFSLLLLSRNRLNIEGFEPLAGEWKTSDRSTVLYGKEETRFPRRFKYGKTEPKIGQRYFQDAKTSTVHFVALTISP